MPLNKHVSRFMHAYGFDRTQLNFTFLPNAASQPVAASFRGTKPGVVSITRTGAGTFAIVFDDTIVDTDFIGMQGTVMLNAATGGFVEFGGYTAATKTLVVRTMTIAGGTTPVDHAANANNRVSIQLIMATRGDNK